MVFVTGQGIVLNQCDPDPQVDDGLLEGWTPFDEGDWDPDTKEEEPEDPPPCEDCEGKGEYLLFQFKYVCDTCGGSGY